MPKYQGRLELTWTNKDQCLLAHDDGSYEWLPPSDYRVAEVRLLHDVEIVGEVGKRRAADNLLISGDALHALTSLTKLPEFGAEYLGKVSLVYLDPPFNTGQAFDHYDDGLEHSVWLTMMRDRLQQIKGLLADTGSVWVHLDDAEMAYCRAVMDDIFDRSNFLGVVAWQRRYDPRNTARHISGDHDYLICFAKDITKCNFNQLLRTDAMIAAYSNPDNDPRGPWRRGDLAARNPYSLGLYVITTPSGRLISGPPSGSYWRTSKHRLEELDADGRVYWGPDGDSRPYIKRFLSEVSGGRVPSSIWTPDEVGFVRNGKEEIRKLLPDLEPFATPKPESLLQRIISIATNPGDIVLDCFVGSGTTAAVAHKMGRRWVAIERSQETVIRFAVPRLKMVVKGDDPGGVSGVDVPVNESLPEGIKPGEARRAARVLDTFFKDGALGEIDEKVFKGLIQTLRDTDKTRRVTVWDGGGGFRVLEIAPSMFEEEDGLVFLAEGLTNGGLAEATAAQLGFEHVDSPPFAGTKGRSKLAVVDGVINEAVVQILVGALDENEKLVICGTGVDPQARVLLRGMRPGSTIRKIPAALLDRYRAAHKPKES